jgi:hypothetical protein
VLKSDGDQIDSHKVKKLENICEFAFVETIATYLRLLDFSGWGLGPDWAATTTQRRATGRVVVNTLGLEMAVWLRACIL